MTRKPLALSVGLVAASLVPAAPALARPAATPLQGTVGAGFTISLVKGGKKVSSLKPGSYAITVTDKATVHDFHLFGPGINKVITGVVFKGKKTVTVKLVSGTYTYQCDPHAAGGMRATFTVAAAPTPTTTTTTPTTTATDPSMSMSDPSDGY
jgi:Copper binding proteins, plastocyanin/azurin family